MHSREDKSLTMTPCLDFQAYTKDDVQKLLHSLNLDPNTNHYTMSPVVKQLYHDAEQEKNMLEMQFKNHDIILEDRDDLSSEANNHFRIQKHLQRSAVLNTSMLKKSGIKSIIGSMMLNCDVTCTRCCLLSNTVKTRQYKQIHAIEFGYL